MNRSQQLARFKPVERLRRLKGEEEAQPSALAGAVSRIAMTADGRLFLDWLWAQTHGKLVPPDAPDSALREVMANRRLFDRILGLVEEPDVGRSSSGPGSGQG